MTIKPGEAWGAQFPQGATVASVADDAALAAWLLDPATAAEPVSPLRGDVLRTLGLDRPRSAPDWWEYPIDIAAASLISDDGSTIETGFVAHLTVRDKPLTGLGPGVSLAVLNAPWMGELRLGPRSHLNDGRLDILEGVVGLRQRREATRRARSGDHLPHPSLTLARTASWNRRFDRPMTLWLDGVAYPGIRSVEVDLQADGGAVIA